MWYYDIHGTRASPRATIQQGIIICITLKTNLKKPVDIWSSGLIMYILLSNGKHPLYERTDTPEKYREKLMNPVWVFGDYFTP